MQIITKGLIGAQDLNLGTGTFTRATSSGGTIVLSQISAATLGAGFPVSGITVPTGLVNNSNTVFTLASTPGTLVMVFRNGVLQNPGVDYVLSSTTITFTVAPRTGDTILAIY